MLVRRVVFGCAAALTASAAFSQIVFGAWYVGQVDKNTSAAATTNDAGSTLSEVCIGTSKSCHWMVVIAQTCDAGHKYPALGNSEQGASQITLVCDGAAKSGLYRYTFDDWKGLEDLLKGSQNLGVALPMESGRFIVHRFSLNGMSQATAKLEKAAGVIPDTGAATVVL